MMICTFDFDIHDKYVSFKWSPRLTKETSNYTLRADPSHSVFGYISFKFEILQQILTLSSFMVTFDIVTNKDCEIFTLSEMTKHGIRGYYVSVLQKLTGYRRIPCQE